MEAAVAELRVFLPILEAEFGRAPVRLHERDPDNLIRGRDFQLHLARLSGQALGNAAVRRAKSEAKVSPRAPVARVSFHGPVETIDALALVQDDLRAAQNISELVSCPSGATAIEVELA